MGNENKLMDKVQEKKTAKAAQAEREEALLGSKAGRDRDDRDRAKRPASRATKLADSVSGNTKKKCTGAK
jgi:hypothetical protein